MTTATDTMTERITLYYREGPSDKVYQAAIEPSGPGYVVTFAFGRRGSTLQAGSKTQTPVGFDEAKTIFDKLVKEKTGKGYTPGEGGTPYQQTDNAARSTGVLPQLLNPITEEDVGQYVPDDRWWMQEKFDGRRLLIRRAGRTITAINRSGLTVALPKIIADAVLSIAATDCLLDGEAVGEVYHAFDLLERNGKDLRYDAYTLRYDGLVDLIDPVASDALRYADIATDAGAKAAMVLQLRNQNCEGVVFKDRTAPYTPGRPASGGTQLKLKFYATCSCIVGGTNGSKRSVRLELADGAKRVRIGNVTIPPGQKIPVAGTVAEIRYLYAYRGGSLYQPVYLGPRDDVVAAECGVNQLKLKADDSEADQDS